VLATVQTERFSFVGLSLGGAVGMQLALDAPERLDRLVLACTSVRFGSRETWDERIELVRELGMESVADAVLPRWFTPAFEDVQTFRAMLVATPPETYVRHCELLREFDLRGALGAIAAPTLAIAGAEDPTSPPEHLESIAAEIDGAHVVVIPRAAHLANVERPKEFNEALLAHLTP
jgi:3-oxoadipate enol-lactonase